MKNPIITFIQILLNKKKEEIDHEHLTHNPGKVLLNKEYRNYKLFKQGKLMSCDGISGICKLRYPSVSNIFYDEKEGYGIVLSYFSLSDRHGVQFNNKHPEGSTYHKEDVSMSYDIVFIFHKNRSVINTVQSEINNLFNMWYSESSYFGEVHDPKSTVYFTRTALFLRHNINEVHDTILLDGLTIYPELIRHPSIDLERMSFEEGRKIIDKYLEDMTLEQ